MLKVGKLLIPYYMSRGPKIWNDVEIGDAVSLVLEQAATLSSNTPPDSSRTLLYKNAHKN